MQRKKKAFTLTELLIVVVVIGTLSAIVLPKFTKILETRKTTEAEDVMSAVRTEQTYRCAAGKRYTTNKSDLGSLASLPDTMKSKNYTYTLESDGGISAKAEEKNYTLKILKYDDGRICCAGADCNALNKNYISCDSLSSSVLPDPCVEAEEPYHPPVPVSVCTEGAVRGEEECSSCGGTRTTEECEGGVWISKLGACSIPEDDCPPTGECEDGDTEYANRTCPNGWGCCYRQCNFGKWGDWVREPDTNESNCLVEEDDMWCCEWTESGEEIAVSESQYHNMCDTWDNGKWGTTGKRGAGYCNDILLGLFTQDGYIYNSPHDDDPEVCRIYTNTYSFGKAGKHTIACNGYQNGILSRSYLQCKEVVCSKNQVVENVDTSTLGCQGSDYRYKYSDFGDGSDD